MDPLFKIIVDTGLSFLTGGPDPLLQGVQEQVNLILVDAVLRGDQFLEAAIRHLLAGFQIVGLD